MKLLRTILISIIFFNVQFAQSVDVKDDANNTLIQINDEGKAGSITFIDGDPPIQTLNKLYNSGSTLYWNGSVLSTSTGDNLGNHTATQDIDLGGFEVNLNGGWLSGDGGKEGIFVDGDGEVGIGISNPSRALQVYDDGITYVNFQSSVTGTGGDDGLEFTISGDNTAYIKNQENASLILGANNNNHLTIDNLGRVGIGTTNPLSKLSVGGIGSGAATIYADRSTSGGQAIEGFASGAGSIGVLGDATSTGGYGVEGKTLGSGGTGVQGTASHTSGVNYGVRGNSLSPNGYAGYFNGRGHFSGNVGIGTTNPLSSMSVGGNGTDLATIYGVRTTSPGRAIEGYATGTSSIGIFGDASGTSGIGVEGDASGSTGVGVAGAASHSTGVNYGVLGQTSSPNGYAGYFGGRGYFSGNVGIGEDNPGYKLEVKDSQSGLIASFENTSDMDPSADVLRLVLSGSGHATGGNSYISFYNRAIYLGAINGDAGGGVNYYSSSDARLKKNIEKPIEGLDIVSKMKVRKYEFKTSPGIEKIGFFAQELQKVYPDAVSGSPDSNVEEDPMMIDYGKLTPILVKAIQELQARVIDLEAKLGG